MLSEDFILFFRSLWFDPFLFWILEVYLYIGVTSLCLYIINKKSNNQDGKLYKTHKINLCKRQICAVGGGFAQENR
jgi:hypothetical protein